MDEHTDDVTIAIATSNQDFEDIYRFRYRIYVEEMDRYRSVADHQGKRLVEPDDAKSYLIVAKKAKKLVGTARWTWGGSNAFTKRHIHQYDLGEFRESVPDEQMIIGERFMIEPQLRGSDLLYRMFCLYMNFVNERRIQLVFGDCEPHLLNVYQGLGFRSYTKRNVNSPETGYLIPLMLVAEDIGYLTTIGSPLASVLKDFGPDARVPDKLDKLLKGRDAVISQRLIDMDDYWANVSSSLQLFDDTRHHLFDDMSPEEIQHCLDKSNVICCACGDRLIKKDNVAQNMFVVLKGILEVRDGDDVVAVLSAGDMFGEIAFFLDLPRTRDVYAATDDVEILCLSDSNLRKLIGRHSKTAAKLLKNIAKMLCDRIVRAR